MRLVFRPPGGDLARIGGGEGGGGAGGGIGVAGSLGDVELERQRQQMVGREALEDADLLAYAVDVAGHGVDQPEMIVRVGVELGDPLVGLQRHRREPQRLLHVALRFRHHDAVEKAVGRFAGRQGQGIGQGFGGRRGPRRGLRRRVEPVRAEIERGADRRREHAGDDRGEHDDGGDARPATSGVVTQRLSAILAEIGVAACRRAAGRAEGGTQLAAGGRRRLLARAAAFRGLAFLA